jgi:hypothetical protein
MPVKPMRKPLPWWLVTILALIAVAVAAFIIDAVLSGGHHENAGKTVRYEVSGDAGAANNVTYMINNGQQQDTEVTLPWSKEFTVGQGFQPLANLGR